MRAPEPVITERKAGRPRVPAEPPVDTGVGRCALGFVAIARGAQGLCALTLGDTAAEALAHVQRLLPGTPLRRNDHDLEGDLSAVVMLVDRGVSPEALAIDARGTAFQQRVWKALCRIPVGETRSYADLARSLGKPQGHRAVARACGANPIAVLVPCHRVIGQDGSLRGYAYGVARKRKLLAQEAGLKRTG